MDANRRLIITRLLALSTFCTQRVAQLSLPVKFSYNDYLDLFAAYKCCEEDADKALYAALHAARTEGRHEDSVASNQEEGEQGTVNQEEARSETSEEGDGQEGGGSKRKAMVVVSAHDFEAFDNLREEFSSAVRQLDERLGSTYEWRMKNQVVPDLILQLEVQLKNWFEEAVFPEMDERVLRRLEYRLGKSIAKDVENLIYPGLKERLLKDLELTKERPPSARGSDSPSSVGSDMRAGKRRRRKPDEDSIV